MGFFDIFKKKQDSAAADIPESRQQQQEELNAGLEKTKTGIFSKLARAVAGRSTVDADLLDDVEEVLITSDVGVETTVKIIRRIEERVARDKYMNTSELQSILREEVMSLMEESHGSEKHFGLDARQGEPYVVMVVGVNGAGKTTTIGKLAAQLTKAGLKVWIGAADTFRAAAIEQLDVWGQRADVPVIKRDRGSDPASVCYDVLDEADKRGSDLVLIDTAGRLHTSPELMRELAKVVNVTRKRAANMAAGPMPVSVVLVIDAATGQNGLNQALEFNEALGLDGIIMTKLDGTAKGGIAMAVAEKLKLPILRIGVGEQVDDLQEFNAKDFCRALVGESN